MAELFKDIYNTAFFDELTTSLYNTIPNFDKDTFLAQVFDDLWIDKELKQRMRHLSTLLRIHLPDDYTEAIETILDLIKRLKLKQNGLSLKYMFLADYVEQYGLNDYKASVYAMERITQFTSCEFAVRPFITLYPEKMMAQMLLWSHHEHFTVRRFSSEGCRPRLPWAMALPTLKKDPGMVIPILERLKNDESEFVRKSVANNLNDIAKDNPTTVINLVKQWQGISINTDKLIKHGCRTLLKQGNSDVMAMFGFGEIKNIHIEDFCITTPSVKIGEALAFSFKLTNSATKDIKVRTEYGLYYQKANGSLSKKVFKISEKDYQKNSTTHINRKQSFKVISTRKFHLGLHQLSIIINGNELEALDFQLVK
jgi:3-methyladenine DNA glycosylase AlkC